MGVKIFNRKNLFAENQQGNPLQAAVKEGTDFMSVCVKVKYC
jgi:hypothetical protein